MLAQRSPSSSGLEIDFVAKLRTRKFVAWGSRPRPGGRATPLTLGRHHELFGSVRIAHNLHGIDLVGACFVLERAWPAGAGFC